ncbi:MAG: MATE family efflux transporter [Lachnospiraceae bacterium]
MANSNVKDMTSGNTMRHILLFSIPVVLGNLFQQFYNMADTIIVGRFLGEDALAAVGSTGSLMFLVLGFAIGIAQGFGIMVSQAFGARDMKLLKHYVALSIMIGLIVSVVMSILTITASRELLILMKTPQNILDTANEYITIIYAGILATMFYNIAAAILRGVGNSRIPLYFLFFSSLLNIVLDLVFILVFHMGPEGAAYATVLSQGISAVLCFYYMFHQFEMLRPKKRDYYFDAGSTRRLLVIALPMALNYSITAIGTMVLQTAVNTFGSSVVAAYTAASKVEMLVTQPMPALATAMATYNGQNLGAAKYQRIFDGMKKAFFLCVALAGISVVLTLFLADPIIHLFLKNPSDEMMTYAMQYLQTICFFYFWLVMVFFYRNSLQGLGISFMPMMSGVFELVGRFLAVALLIGPFGYWAVRLASPVAWFLAAVPLMFTYASWKKKIIATHKDL